MSYSIFIKHVYRFLAAGIIIFFFTIQSLAQSSTNNYTVSFLPIEDGLSQSTNWYMLQDSKGYMWISSMDGINRYNGKEFFHFNSSLFYENCKPIKQVYGLTEDTNGDIWMGSMQGLYRYQQGRNKFKMYDIFTSNQSADIITMPFATVGNEIWVTDGRFSFKAIDCNTQQIRTLFQIPDSLRPVHFSIKLPQPDGKGNIWVATDNSIYRISIKNNSVQTFPIFLSQISHPKNVIVTDFSIQSSSNVLAVGTTLGMILFDTEKYKAIAIKDDKKLVSNEDIWYIKAEKDYFLVANEKCPLIKVALNGKTVTPLLDKKVLDNDIHRGTRTACMYRDKWNRLWLSANGEYIAIIDFASRFIKKIAREKVNGLPNGTVVCISSIDNNIWVSDFSLTVINKTTGNVEKRIDPKSLPGHPADISQLFYDSLLQRIWMSAGEKIYYYDIQADKFIKTKFNFLGSGFDKLRCFAILKSGELLLVCRDGVWQVDKECSTGFLIPEFGTGIINQLYVLSGNRLALSAIGQSLKIFEYRPGAGFKEIESINLQSAPMMVSEDTASGIIWVATNQGVYKINNSSYKILRHYGVADGMANEFIYAVIPDKYGWIWCSTNKGIVAINTANDQVLNFDMNQNLQDLEFNNRAFTHDKDGYIYFGGVKGMNYFKPPFTESDTVKPRLVIEEISLNDAPYSHHNNPDEIATIRYDYGAAALSIKVEALHLIKSSSLKITYRLKGQQKDWIVINNGEKIQMFNLASGNYELEISYTDGSRNKIFPNRLIHITVLPPWYATWWFLLLIVLTTIAAIWFIITRGQKRKLKKLQQANEISKLKAEQELAMAQERERITADLHDDVGATLSSMHIYGDLANTVWDTQPQQSKDMVGKISLQSKELMNRMSDIVWSLKPSGEEKNSFTGRLRNYTHDLLTAKNIAAVFAIDEALVVKITNPLARKNILLIAKEAINNIAKYSQATEAIITFKQQEQNVILTISDNGKGFNKSLENNGNGLGNIEQRCKQLSGHCTIETSEAKGVLITCQFPIAIISHTG